MLSIDLQLLISLNVFFVWLSFQHCFLQTGSLKEEWKWVFLSFVDILLPWDDVEEIREGEKDMPGQEWNEKEGRRRSCLFRHNFPSFPLIFSVYNVNKLYSFPTSSLPKYAETLSSFMWRCHNKEHNVKLFFNHSIFSSTNVGFDKTQLTFWRSKCFVCAVFRLL